MPSQVLVAGLMIKNRYHVRNKLGEGKFGEVYKAYDKVEKMDVALKAVATVNTVEDKEDASAIGEARILLLLNKNKCKGSPQLYDYFSYKSHSLLVMELFKTDFHQLLKNHPKKSFSKQSLLHFGYHVIVAIKSIHQIGIIHRDIKPANIFLRNHQTNSMKLVIGDLGMAVKFESGFEKPGMRIRVAARDFDFSKSPYHSLGMAEGRAAQESDDLEMIAYMVMYARGIRPFVGSVTEMIAKRKELHQNPGNMVRGNNGWLKTIVELLLNQEYGSTPRYQEILDEIASHSRIPVSRDFHVVVNTDGTSYLKDF
ncbi:hypothetical protein CAEBREN_17025 [Caenorhabditis brenneri]|uniref:Protein kinase domain-containing protein n=1 Tax=Caenorhabditis brenneri TaxID=135651 RepID=G0P2T3_CAEBE|nr:hypothetical protein CAEBREN_17025 [Caenorhabditis brenneri]